MNSKYIVVRERMVDGMGDPVTDSDGKFIDHENIYVFSPKIIHSAFARKVSTRGRVKGAGFIGRQEDGKHFCYGRSDSLNVASRKEDTTLLRLLLGEPV